ncbi:type 2 isopentenyl-diphosphate Delta-isomerase [Enterococcus sp. LJL128]
MNNRKDEHLSLAKAFHKEQENDFDRLRFVHHSLPEASTETVDLTTHFLGFSLPLPFYINAMTGGSEKTKKINQQLGIIARETGVLVATGSVSAALKDPTLSDSYSIVRKENPNGKILANIGAGTSLDDAKRAVELFKADGLQIHLNAPQELVMPEGDRDFTSWLEQIEEINQQLDCPLMVKEVGFGMSSQTLAQLFSIGIQTVDVSGRGGTSFTQIENARRKKRELSFLNDWGQSTVISLLESSGHRDKMTILASGGIRNSLDIIKALSLGAKGVGISGTILTYLMSNGLDAAIALVRQWQEELTLLYTLLGKRTTEELTTTDLVFDRSLIDWCESRGIPYQYYSQRSSSF